ncbi:MAG: hypothetical protein KJ955_03160 [Nanoarchaeota archaeon]|nr:hypothetical protein [Nanoarchaeota archaeon]
MKPEQILETVVSRAFNDFDIPVAERDDFKETVAGMFDDQAMHAPIDSTERFMHVLSTYSDASRRSQTYKDVPIVDAACYATELCLALHYAGPDPLLKDAIKIICNINTNEGYTRK